MNKPTLEEIKCVMLSLGMKVFTKPFDMTLGGVRTNDNTANTFNDWMFMLYHDEHGKLCGIVEQGTTDAGLYYRLNPIDGKRTCIIAHSKQYRGAFEYQNPKVDGKRGHRGQEAFRQIGGMDYFLDTNKDGVLDFVNKVFNKIFNTNGHLMGTLGKLVNKWSAGCWGSVEKIMQKFFDLAKLQIKHGHGTKFSFAMLHENDFKK